MGSLFCDDARFEAFAMEWTDDITKERLEEVLTKAAGTTPDDFGCAADAAQWLDHFLKDICNACKQWRSNKSKFSWWKEDLVQSRKDWTRFKGIYTKKRREGDPEGMKNAEMEWKSRKIIHKEKIRKAKKDEWVSLAAVILDDPWGRPYKFILKQLTTPLVSITQKMDEGTVDRILDELFPLSLGNRKSLPTPPLKKLITNEGEVTAKDLLAACRRMGSYGSTYGPDGIVKQVVVTAVKALPNVIANVFTLCWREQCFPEQWKKGRLVLQKKPGKHDGVPLSYRPICFFNEIGKLFECVIDQKMRNLLASLTRAHLPQYSFIFRPDSPICAIDWLRQEIKSATENGRITIVTRLHLPNAYNSLSWCAIRKALHCMKFPQDIRAIVDEYLHTRKIMYNIKRRKSRFREFRCGVPERSVLGFLLWRLTFDFYLRTQIPPGSTLLCYDHKILLVTHGPDLTSAKIGVETSASLIIEDIREMGLTVASHKAQVAVFGLPPAEMDTDFFRNLTLRIGTSDIVPSSTIKYLGLVIDTEWSFRQHFEALLPKVEAVSAKLRRFLSVNEPSARKLYNDVIWNMLSYGAPIWADDITRSKSIVDAISDTQRKVALRIIQGYDTISLEDALALAEMPPLPLVAPLWKEAYRISGDGHRSPPSKDVVIRRWVKWLTVSEREAATTILPILLLHFDEWTKRKHGTLMSFMTQMLTGHGFFNSYLYGVGHSETKACVHCSTGEEDTVDHTLAVCTAWDTERKKLREIHDDLRISAIVPKILESEAAWAAFAVFCYKVMPQKESVVVGGEQQNGKTEPEEWPSLVED